MWKELKNEKTPPESQSCQNPLQLHRGRSGRPVWCLQRNRAELGQDGATSHQRHTPDADPWTRPSRLPTGTAGEEQAEMLARRNVLLQMPRTESTCRWHGVDYEPKTATMGNLIGMCPDCETIMNRRTCWHSASLRASGWN